MGERLLLHGGRDDGREGELVALNLIPKDDIADPNAAAVEDLVWAVVDLFKILGQRAKGARVGEKVRMNEAFGAVTDVVFLG